MIVSYNGIRPLFMVAWVSDISIHVFSIKSSPGKIMQKVRLFIVAYSSVIALWGCGTAPAPQCIEEGLSELQQGGFSETANQSFCENINTMMVAISNNTCKPSETFAYIADNTEEIIEHSVLAGLPEDDKKKEVLKIQKAARALVDNCKLHP